MVSTSITQAKNCWALKGVWSKFSKGSWDNIGQLFKVMLPDSKVRESFSCSKSVIQISLMVLLFLQCLQDEVKASPYHVISNVLIECCILVKYTF